MREDDLVSLVESIHEAALAPERWRDVLASFASAVGGEQAALGVTDINTTRSVLQVEHNLDPELIRTWVEEFGASECWAEGARRRGVRAGSVVTGAELVDPEELFASEVWRGCFGRYGVDDALAVLVGGPPDHLGYVGAYRSRARGFFGETERRIAAALVRPLELAATSHARLATSWQQDQLDLAASPFGVALLDARGSVQTWNDEARRIADARDGLAFMRGKLVALDARAQRRLEDAIARASLPAEAGGEGAVLRIARRSGSQPYQLCVLPVPRRTGERLFAWTTRPPSALVIVSDPEVAVPPDARALRRLFDLTPTLARLALALAAGRTLAEYAADEGASPGAAHRRLRELLAVTGASDEDELRRALREPALALPTARPRPRHR